MLTHDDRWSGQRGFSLVELMVVVAIMAVLYGIAAPSFSSMMTNNRVRTGADGIVAGLQLARAEAIHRNTNVSFTLNTGTGWTVAVVSPNTTIQTRPTIEAGDNLQITPLNGQSELTFTPMGRVAGYNASSNLTRITVAPSANASGDSFQIDISAGGQIRLCNPAIVTANDPRQC